MDELYVGGDMQRNFRFKTWHELDTAVQRDLTDLGGPLSVDNANPYPWVRMVTPLDLQELKAPTDVTIKVNTATEDGKAAKVELRDNGKLIQTSSEPSFAYTIKGIDTGDHVLSARVIDPSGATKEHVVTACVFNSETKDSLPWKEEFTLANETTSDDGKTSWTATRSKGVFTVKESTLFINDKGDEGNSVRYTDCWKSGFAAIVSFQFTAGAFFAPPRRLSPFDFGDRAAFAAGRACTHCSLIVFYWFFDFASSCAFNFSRWAMSSSSLAKPMK